MVSLFVHSCSSCGLLVVILGDVVAQRQQRVGEVDVLNDGAALGSGQLDVGEVPDRVHAVRGEKLGGLNRVSLGNTQNGCIDLVFGKELRQGGHVVDFTPS